MEEGYGGNQEKPTRGGCADQQPDSKSELLSEAKYLAETAQQAMRGETEEIDKSRLAGAADNVLEAASKYGNLDDKGFGQYVDKAQGYLHQYGGHSSSQEQLSGTASGDGGRPKEEERYPASGGGAEEERTESESGGGRSKEEEESGGGYGDYAKMATGFLKKF